MKLRLYTSREDVFTFNGMTNFFRECEALRHKRVIVILQNTAYLLFSVAQPKHNFHLIPTLTP